MNQTGIKLDRKTKWVKNFLHGDTYVFEQYDLNNEIVHSIKVI